jgi:hypothetical protein
LLLDKTGERGTNNTLETWTKLSGGAPVPASLQAAHQRLLNRAQTSTPDQIRGIAPEQGGALLEPSAPDIQEPGLLAAPNGCNNGCCDLQWLSTFSQCQNSLTYNWFAYNYGSSYANTGSDIKKFRGLVCAATGTSTWSVTIGPNHITQPVAEANVFTWGWDAYCAWWGCNDYPASTSVNTPTNQHLHTYCGGWNY